VTWGLNQKMDILILIMIDFDFLPQAEFSVKKIFKLGRLRLSSYVRLQGVF
jgi:hypothetical protein